MDAKKALQEHLDELFSEAPPSRAAYELREELLANSLERYGDLIRGGLPEQQALDTVMGNIGNVDELLAALPDGAQNYAGDERRAKSAMMTAISIGLYILAGVVFFVGVLLSSLVWNEAVILGLILAILICIPPTCMLVYNAVRWPSYKKQEDTVVEEFKEWNSDNKRARSLRGAISSVVWTLTVVLYFLISFVSGAWAFSWMIFLIAACVETVITLVFRMRELR